MVTKRLNAKWGKVRRYYPGMQLNVLLMVPSDRSLERTAVVDCQVVPRIGEVLDLAHAGRQGEPPEGFEVARLVVVAQIIHALGPEPDCHRVIARVVRYQDWDWTRARVVG